MANDRSAERPVRTGFVWDTLEGSRRVGPGRRELLEASLQAAGKLNGKNLWRIPRSCTSGLQLRPPHVQGDRPA